MNMHETEGPKLRPTIGVEAPKPYEHLIEDFHDLSSLTVRIFKDDRWRELQLLRPIGIQEDALTIFSSRDGSEIEVGKKIDLDLANNNILLRMNVWNAEFASKLSLQLSDNLGNHATSRLGNMYIPEFSGEWLSISLGRGKRRDTGGQWRIKGDTFDWGNINEVKFSIASTPDNVAALGIARISSVPARKEGSVVIVFDDSYSSILPAAEALHANGLKANVAVIGKYVDKTKGYLTLRELKALQNDWGWSIINHSWKHRNAVTDYSQTGNLQGFEQDILRGAKYLEDNHINSAPNWYVYPSGATNAQIRAIVGKYYKFARTTLRGPEYYPFGEDLLVKTFLVGDDMPISSVKKAIDDVREFKLTLFLTFHSIRSAPDNRKGYALDNFAEIAKYIKEQDISTKTTAELDEKSSVPVENSMDPNDPSEKLI